jgi:glucuronoarabinoxylan endo-1,4-beta-xylanase
MKRIGILGIVSLAGLIGVASMAQTSEPTQLEKARALVAEVEAKLSELKVVLADPPPPPVDCQMSEPTLVSASEWSACSAEGVQSRTEIWDRTVLVEAANGGAACPVETSETSTATQSCEPPPVVNCELSDWTLASATDWSACSASGTQTRQETYTRSVLVAPENGGTPCGELIKVVSASQACQAPEPPPPASGAAHDYFNALVKRSNHAASYSLRYQAQLAQYSQKRADGSQDINYVWPNDPDPRKQDAAKLVIPSDGTTIKSSTNQNSILQVRVPMPTMELGHSYLVTWDAWYGDEWREDISGIPAHKAFQFDGPDRLNGAPKIWWEVHHAYKSVGDYPVASNEVARLAVRHYASGMRQLDDGTWIGVPAGPNVTSGSTSETPVLPYRQFNVKPERWVRHWQLIEYGMDPEPWRSNPPGTLMSLWAADEDRSPVQLYNRLQVTLWQPGIRKFWIEINTSTNEVKANRGPMVAYFRNVVILKDVSFADVPALLQRPVGGVQPSPDPNPVSEPEPEADVLVKWDSIKQTIDGFGASSYANEFPDAVIANADLLFDKDKGVGLSLMRMALPHNPDTGGRPYKDPAIAKLAAARGATVWASNFYPPAKWKSNGIPTSGGTLLPAHYQDYADLLADEIQDLKAQHGVELYALSIQNEADKSQTWGSCVFSDAQMKAFLQVLHAEFTSRNLSTKIMLPEESSWTFRRAAAAMSDPTTAAMVGILAAHRYSSPDGWASPFKGIKPIWQTEHSIGSDTAHSISTALTQAVEIHNFMVQSEANAWHAWNLGVIMGGKRLYTLGNWSKFVRPGWVRLETTQTSDVLTTAFKNRSTGEFAIVLVNTASGARTRNVGLSGVSASSVVPWVTSDALNLQAQAAVVVSSGVFAAVVPGQSVTTFVGKAGE